MECAVNDSPYFKSSFTAPILPTNLLKVPTPTPALFSYPLAEQKVSFLYVVPNLCSDNPVAAKLLSNLKDQAHQTKSDTCLQGISETKPHFPVPHSEKASFKKLLEQAACNQQFQCVFFVFVGYKRVAGR